MTARVLLVDDDPNVLDGLRRALHQEPYGIIVAGDAMAGLDLLANSGADVVISDQDMPGMRGTEFLSRVSSCATRRPTSTPCSPRSRPSSASPTNVCGLTPTRDAR